MLCIIDNSHNVYGKRVASVSLIQNCCTVLAQSIGVNIKRHRGIPPDTHMIKVNRTIESSKMGGYVRISYMHVAEDMEMGFDESGLHLTYRHKRLSLDRGLPEYKEKLLAVMQPEGKAGVLNGGDYHADPMVEETFPDLPIMFMIGQCINMKDFAMEAGKEDLELALKEQVQDPILTKWSIAVETTRALKRALVAQGAYTGQAYSAWLVM